MTPFLFVLATKAQKPVHPGGKPTLSAAQQIQPVSARDAREAFLKFFTQYGKVSNISLGTPSIPTANRPVTRIEVITEMRRIYRAAEPTIRFTPAPISFDEKKFVVNAKTGPFLRYLVAQGFVGKVSPLAVGPNSTLSVREFGDALGFFGVRLAQVSHLPSPKWTPMLKID